MTDPYLHNREFFGSVSGNYRVAAVDTGPIVLVPTIPANSIFVQKLHIEVTTIAGAELWTFQDGAGIPIVPSVSAAAIAHFDFDFGPDGVPCTEATAFVLNITGATGGAGWVTWEGFKKLTLGTPVVVGSGAAAAPPAPLVVTSLKSIGPVGIGPAAVPDVNHPLSIVDAQAGQMQGLLFNTSVAAAAYAEWSVRANDLSVYYGSEGSTSGDAYGKNRGYMIVQGPVAANLGLDFSVSQSGSYRFHSQPTGVYGAGTVVFAITPAGVSAPGDGTFLGANGVQIRDGAFFYWTTFSGIRSQLDGRLTFTKNDFLTGIGLDFTLDGTIRFRNRAFTQDGQIAGASVRGNAVTFANLPAAPVEGMVAWVTDSTVNTWGTVIAGGGANHVLACFNGTAWTVAGK